VTEQTSTKSAEELPHWYWICFGSPPVKNSTPNASRRRREDPSMTLTEELHCASSALDLSEHHRSQLDRLAWLEEVPEGILLFEEKQDARFIYFVLEGVVGLGVGGVGGEAVEIDRIGPGELLGWSPVFGRRSMTASARTVTPCRLAAVEVSRLVDLCERDPQFGLAFLRQVGLHLSERLRSTRRALALARTLHQRSPYALRHEGSD
jgi:CRP-like cAMP-binding protein